MSDYPQILGYFIATDFWWDDNWKRSKGTMTFSRIHPCLWFFHPKKELVEQVFAMYKLQGDVFTGKHAWGIYMVSEIRENEYKIDKT